MARTVRVIKVICEVGWGLALLVPHLTRFPRFLLNTKGTDGNICHVLATVDLENLFCNMAAFALDRVISPQSFPRCFTFAAAAVSSFPTPTFRLPVPPPSAPLPVKPPASLLPASDRIVLKPAAPMPIEAVAAPILFEHQALVPEPTTQMFHPRPPHPPYHRH